MSVSPAIDIEVGNVGVYCGQDGKDTHYLELSGVDQTEVFGANFSLYELKKI